jgi:HSP20 family protein
MHSVFDFNDPFRWMQSFERQLDRRLRPAPGREAPVTQTYLRDMGAALQLRVDLPGVREKDIELTIEGDVLTLRADGTRSRPEGFRAIRTERTPIRFAERIELPARVDNEHVEATFKNGVLEVTLPKAADAKPRKIAIGAPKEQPAS